MGSRIAASWSPRRIESYVQAAGAIRQICDETRIKQTVFLASIGMTWEQARALDAEGRARIQKLWEVRNGQ